MADKGVLLGIDYGDSRIGISACDSMRILATPRCIVDGKQNLKSVVAEISEIAKREKAVGIVVGWPLNMDGTEGPRIHRTTKFIEAFATANPEIEIVRWDERLTTKEADKSMIAMGVSQRHKGVSDMIAAQIILESYIESL